MSHDLDVYVRDSHGNPVEGENVIIWIDGMLTGGKLEESTDDGGHAAFETADDYEGSRELKIYVRGQSFGPYYISGGAYTVTLD